MYIALDGFSAGRTTTSFVLLLHSAGWCVAGGGAQRWRWRRAGYLADARAGRPDGAGRMDDIGVMYVWQRKLCTAVCRMAVTNA